MEIKRKNAQDELLQARHEGLSQADKRSLRPLGKCWGLDVFSWVNPSSAELASTIEYFPFPIDWLGNESMIVKMAQDAPMLVQSLHWLGQYDNAKFPLSKELVKLIPMVSATQNLTDALELLKHNRELKTIVLFTVHGSEWEQSLSQFEAYIKLHQ